MNVLPRRWSTALWASMLLLPGVTAEAFDVGIEINQASGDSATLEEAEALDWTAALRLGGNAEFGGEANEVNPGQDLDPAAELPVIAVASGARMHVRNGETERTIPATDFFQGMFMIDMEPEEILVEVVFPSMPPRSGWSFMEISRRRGDYAMMGVAIRLTLDETGECTAAKLVYLNAGDGPIEAVDAAQALIGSTLDEGAIEQAARIASENEIDPFGNVHASPEYQRHLARVLSVRALGTALTRAQVNGKAGQ